MRKVSIVLLTLLCGTTLAQAQGPQAYYPGAPYPPVPANPFPYSVPPQYGPPVQPVQYQSGYTPGSLRRYPNPRSEYTPGPYGYYNGYGVNYFYANNPMGYSATPAPYSAVANSRALGKEPIGWPAPVGADAVLTAPPAEEGEARPPEIPYHRPTKEIFWASADYLGAFIRPMRLSGPLVTTGSPNDPLAGSLGRPTTAVLFGNDPVNFNLLSGVRLEAGMFIDSCDRFSLELAGFLLFPGTQSYTIAGDSNGFPVITRPVFRTESGREGNFVNSLPGNATGTFLADFRTQLGSAEINFRYHEYVKERLHLDALFGFRYLRLREQMQILENVYGLLPGFLTFNGAPIAANEHLIDNDLFMTTNQFFGPQIGGRASWEHSWLTFTGFAKVALGASYQQTTIEGTTTKVGPGGNTVASGGILALPSNIGTHSRTIFGIVPEFGLNVGVDVTSHVRLKLGYSVLLWNHVLRPGSQFDRAMNTGQVPGNVDFGKVNGPFAPIYRFNEELFWIQSLNLGIEVHY